MAVNLKNNKYVENFQKGLKDISLVSQEGNFKLFAKQAVVVFLAILLFRYMNGKFETEKRKYQGAKDSISMQQSSQDEYLRNRDLLFKLEPPYSDISEKNEGLTSMLIGVYKDSNMTPEFVGTQTEDSSNPAYEVVSRQTTMNMGFVPFAEFIAKIESRDELIKVSSFSVEKDTSFDHIGNNKINLQFSTILLKEKVAKTLFKDYDKVLASMKEKQGEK